MTSLSSLLALSDSYLGLSSLIDLSCASRINGGSHPYSTEFHALLPCLLRKKPHIGFPMRIVTPIKVGWTI